MEKLRVLGLIVLCALGCRKAESTAPPGPPPEALDPAPADDGDTYVSGKKAAADPVDAGDDADAAASEEPAPAPGIPAKVETIQAARELVAAVADAAFGAGSERLVSPAMVPAWPNEGHTLVFVVYPMVPTKSGINAFKVGVPLEVKVDLVEGTTAQRTLKRGQLMQTAKVERDTASVRVNLENAEQTLIDVVLERRPIARSLVLLDGYREWFNHHLEMMTDLDKRMPSTIRWLRKPHAPAP